MSRPTVDLIHRLSEAREQIRLIREDSLAGDAVAAAEADEIIDRIDDLRARLDQSAGD